MPRTAFAICQDGALDVDRIVRWLSIPICSSARGGGTEIDARQRLLEVMRSGHR